MPSTVNLTTVNGNSKAVHGNGNSFEKPSKTSSKATTHNGTKVSDMGSTGNRNDPTSTTKSKYVPAVIGTTKALTSIDRPTSTINNLKPTIVGMWNLRNTSAKLPESYEALGYTNGTVTVETVFDTDDRKKVRKEDFGPGGKYRCTHNFFIVSPPVTAYGVEIIWLMEENLAIVKLFLKFEGKGGSRTLVATGWLIAADVIVTAGHCAYDCTSSSPLSAFSR